MRPPRYRQSPECGQRRVSMDFEFMDRRFENEEQRHLGWYDQEIMTGRTLPRVGNHSKLLRQRAFSIPSSLSRQDRYIRQIIVHEKSDASSEWDRHSSNGMVEVFRTRRLGGE